MTPDEVVQAFAELICKLQVPISIESEMPLAARRLEAIRNPWGRLHREIVGFGWGTEEIVAQRLSELLGTTTS